MISNPSRQSRVVRLDALTGLLAERDVTTAADPEHPISRICEAKLNRWFRCRTAANPKRPSMHRGFHRVSFGDPSRARVCTTRPLTQ
jgi:hypothetical protein